MSRPRPPAQRVGKQVMLASNHFPFRLRAPGPFHQYSVAFYVRIHVTLMPVTLRPSRSRSLA